MPLLDTLKHWSKAWVDRVVRKGLMTGDANGTTFRPEDYVKRGEMAVMLDRVPMNWGDVFEYAAPAVVWIGRGGHGSGFVLTDTGYIVTAKHVVADDDDLSDWQSVRFMDGSVDVADVVKGHPFADLAILKLRTKKNPFTIPLDDKTTVKKCDEVMLIGHPSSIEWESTRAQIERVTVGTKSYEFDVTGNYAGGYSGGAVVNQSGEVLGIVIRNTGDCTNLLAVKQWVEASTK